MREITPSFTPEIQGHLGPLSVAQAPGYKVNSYRELLEHVARLSHLNKDHLLFFRGQAQDYRNKNGGTTLYPSIYRMDRLDSATLRQRFDRLERASKALRRLCSAGNIQGHSDVARKPVIQWSVIQHYEVCDTPLLDLTHSLRVACSFAQANAEEDSAFVYVLGLPYLTNRISVNSEHDLVVVRLLSICPPSALRPYFQEGYLAGTSDVTTEYDNKTELDFSNRLIAKFRIPPSQAFWGTGLSRVSDEELYPSDDEMKTLCDTIEQEAESDVEPSTVGEFVAAWTGLEQLLVTLAQSQSNKLLTFAQAVQQLRAGDLLSVSDAKRIIDLRILRNAVVHGSGQVTSQKLREATSQLKDLRAALKRRKSRRSSE